LRSLGSGHLLSFFKLTKNFDLLLALKNRGWKLPGQGDN